MAGLSREEQLAAQLRNANIWIVYWQKRFYQLARRNAELQDRLDCLEYPQLELWRRKK